MKATNLILISVVSMIVGLLTVAVIKDGKRYDECEAKGGQIVRQRGDVFCATVIRIPLESDK